MRPRESAFIFTLFATTLFLTGCNDSSLGSRPREVGRYDVEWGTDITDSFDISVYPEALKGEPNNLYTMTYASCFYNQQITAENMHIGFAPSYEAGTFPEGEKLARYSIPSTMKNYTDNIRPYIKDAEEYGGWLFSFCSINGALSITADKCLFGRSAGSELNDKFIISSVYPPVRTTFPNFTILDTEISPVGLPVSSFFYSGQSLAQSRYHDGLYEIRYSSVPDEDYDQITFSFSLPISRYDYYRYLIHETASPSFENRVLSGQVTVYFGRTTRENWDKNSK